MTDKDLLTFKSEREIVALIIVSIILFIIFLTLSQWFLSENCYIYEWRQVGLLCDSLELPAKNPRPCPVCENEMMRLVAQFFCVLAIVSLTIPAIVHLTRKVQSRPHQDIKLFD